MAVLLIGCHNADSQQYVSDWPDSITRQWIGPDYWSNRLQDWRLHDNRLECIEADRQFPMRTVQHLSAYLSDEPGDLVMNVRTGPVDEDLELPEEAWTGFLIGAGGRDIDHRITAYVHGRPAEDGGLVAAIDGRGNFMFRDNRISGEKGLPELMPVVAQEEPGLDEPLREVSLKLIIEPSGNAYSLRLEAADPGTGELLQEARLDNVEPELVEGSLALVSNFGPEGSQHGFWYEDWNMAGSKLSIDENRRYGPVLATQYTLSDSILNLTAQMGPLGGQDTRTAQLQVQAPEDTTWTTVATSSLQDMSYTFPFRVENWDGNRTTPFRVVYNLISGEGLHRTYYQGTIAKNPVKQDSFTVAAFTGHKCFTGGLKWNSDAIWFPHNELIAAVKQHSPDFLFFSGDQIYENDLTPGDRRSVDKTMLDYLYKWYRWCWAFGELSRDIPTVCIPDDHDVYHGNIWGAGGRHAETQDDGGYLMPPEFVNAVERTQTSHLPAPYDPTPVEQGIGVYYTDINYGGVSFAVIEDRKWKSSPTVAVPEGDFDNGWSQNPDFDPATQADVPGANLLGERQLRFLNDWSKDWSNGIWMKVVLSQTVFANVTTKPKEATSGAIVARQARTQPLPRDQYRIPGEVLSADADSDGWPQTGRDEALREFRRAFALHISGDQHLGSTIQYGIDDWRDAGYSLCVPSIANTHPRRWYPPYTGLNQKLGEPPYTGDYLDGFGNYMTVLAVSNPVRSGHEPANLYNRAPGYGIVRMHKASRKIQMEIWPRWVDPSQPDARQYNGWPVQINQSDNYGRQAAAWLPEIEVAGMEDPVIQVINEHNEEVIYSLRITGSFYRAKVFEPGTYTINVGEPGTNNWRTITNVQAIPSDFPEEEHLDIRFDE